MICRKTEAMARSLSRQMNCPTASFRGHPLRMGQPCSKRGQWVPIGCGAGEVKGALQLYGSGEAQIGNLQGVSVCEMNNRTVFVERSDPNSLNLSARPQ